MYYLFAYKLNNVKDKRYEAVKSLIEAKKIGGLNDIFTVIPISVVNKDIGSNYNTLRQRIKETDPLTFKDFRLMAAVFGVDPVELFKLAILDAESKD